jgi:hypothetical protein
MKPSHLAIATCFILIACNSSIDQNRDQITTQAEVEKTGNAQAAGASTPVTNSQLQPAAITLPTAASGATKRLNPAHGQPGHDCAVAVGAPLNTAPVQSGAASVAPINRTATTTPVTAPQAGVAPVSSQPAPASSISAQQPQLGGANVKSTARLNPAHGQPGHNCDVAVGQPLKQ